MMAETGEVARRRGDVFAVIGVFALGLICGAALFLAGTHLARGQWATFSQRLTLPRHAPVARLTRELDLDAAQQEKVRAVLERTRDQVHEIVEKSRAEIRALLRPDQQEKLDRMRPPGGRRLRGEGRHTPAP